MRVSDFILQTRTDLQEKSEHWNDEDLLIKLKRAYVSLQYDLPYFIQREELSIIEGNSEYYLEYEALKNVSLIIDEQEYLFSNVENFYTVPKERTYTFMQNRLLVSTPKRDSKALIFYRHCKMIETLNCFVELPIHYHNALRLLFLSYIQEKPTRNSKERNLSLHYLKLYEKELYKLKKEQKARPKNIKSNYQKV